MPRTPPGQGPAKHKRRRLGAPSSPDVDGESVQTPQGSSAPTGSLPPIAPVPQPWGPAALRQALNEPPHLPPWLQEGEQAPAWVQKCSHAKMLHPGTASPVLPRLGWEPALLTGGDLGPALCSSPAGGSRGSQRPQPGTVSRCGCGAVPPAGGTQPRPWEPRGEPSGDRAGAGTKGSRSGPGAAVEGARPRPGEQSPARQVPAAGKGRCPAPAPPRPRRTFERDDLVMDGAGRVHGAAATRLGSAALRTAPHCPAPPARARIWKRRRHCRSARPAAPAPPRNPPPPAAAPPRAHHPRTPHPPRPAPITASGQAPRLLGPCPPGPRHRLRWTRPRGCGGGGQRPARPGSEPRGTGAAAVLTPPGGPCQGLGAGVPQGTPPAHTSGSGLAAPRAGARTRLRAPLPRGIPLQPLPAPGWHRLRLHCSPTGPEPGVATSTCSHPSPTHAPMGLAAPREISHPPLGSPVRPARGEGRRARAGGQRSSHTAAQGLLDPPAPGESPRPCVLH